MCSQRQRLREAGSRFAAEARLFPCKQELLQSKPGHKLSPIAAATISESNGTRAQEDNVRRKEAAKALEQPAKRRKTGDGTAKQAPQPKQWWQEGDNKAAEPDDDRAFYRQEVRSAGYALHCSRLPPALLHACGPEARLQMHAYDSEARPCLACLSAAAHVLAGSRELLRV